MEILRVDGSLLEKSNFAYCNGQRLCTYVKVLSKNRICNCLSSQRGDLKIKECWDQVLVIVLLERRGRCVHAFQGYFITGQ